VGYFQYNLIGIIYDAGKLKDQIIDCNGSGYVENLEKDRELYES
jgi:hypothetical protein